MDHKMFCYQCQETAGCSGCTMVGVCGKQPKTAGLQDLLIYVTKGLSQITTLLRAEGTHIDSSVDQLIHTNLFITITNANFDDDAIADAIRKTLAVRSELAAQVSFLMLLHGHRMTLRK